MTDDTTGKINEMLSEENSKLRRAGAELCVAAIRVATEYDGTHRLLMAVSDWCKVAANEHGRGNKGRGE